MLIHGTPLEIPYSGGTETEPRFWYWHGATGRRYIHSVYRPETCPPLPGAVFLAVRSLGNLRTVLGAGRFAGLWDVNIPTENAAHWQSLGANEIHVHLLSRDETEARQITADLKAALQVGVTVPAGEPIRLGPSDAKDKEHRTEKCQAVLGPSDAKDREHRTEKCQAVFGSSDAKNKEPGRRSHSASNRTPGTLAA